MIERINSEEEIKELIQICKNDKDGHILCCAKLNLSSNSIQKWITEGKFKHLKNELNIYNNVKFGCLKHDNGCQYYFFGSRDANKRILNFLEKLLNDEQIYLKDCKSDSSWEESKYYTTFIPSDGKFNACPLF